METLIVFASLVALAVSVWATLFITIPAIGRARFVTEASALRDDIDDALIDGRLPNDPCVTEMVERLGRYIDDPKSVSLTLLLAIHSAYEEHGQKLAAPQKTFANLTGPQRLLMHKFDRRETEVLARRLVYGSSMFVPWKVARTLSRGNARKVSGMGTRPEPRQLAREYQGLDRRREVPAQRRLIHN